jgi:hypothetical protein
MSEIMLSIEQPKEEYIVVYNLLRKIIDSSFSASPILAIHSSELGIVNKNCLLLRIKDRDLFFANPQLLFCGSSLTITSDNIDFSFEGKEMEKVMFYFYANKYLDILQKIYI